jgi:UDP-3-O-[3-hydroxymyristoyl] glucosamine N-acyltransferase
MRAPAIAASTTSAHGAPISPLAGENCFILEDNTVQPFVTIGNNVTLWSGNHIGHDSCIEDDCFITRMSLVSGHVRVGAGSFLGVNATLRNSISIAPESLIAAGR